VNSAEPKRKRCEVCQVHRFVSEFPSYLLIPLWYSGHTPLCNDCLLLAIDEHNAKV
jgi:hypothetical protein